jgi:hypothetical protein
MKPRVTCLYQLNVGSDAWGCTMELEVAIWENCRRLGPSHRLLTSPGLIHLYVINQSGAIAGVEANIIDPYFAVSSGTTERPVAVKLQPLSLRCVTALGSQAARQQQRSERSGASQSLLRSTYYHQRPQLLLGFFFNLMLIAQK